MPGYISGYRGPVLTGPAPVPDFPAKRRTEDRDRDRTSLNFGGPGPGPGEDRTMRGPQSGLGPGPVLDRWTVLDWSEPVPHWSWTAKQEAPVSAAAAAGR